MSGQTSRCESDTLPAQTVGDPRVVAAIAFVA